MPDVIRVLQLASPSGLFGAEHWILALIKHLNPQRVKSFVATIRSSTEDTGEICNISRKLGFPSFVVDAPGRINGSAIKQLRNIIVQEQIDIIHTHGYKTDIIGLLAIRGTRCKIVSTPHGWTKHPDSKLRLYEILDRFAFMFCDAIAPLSGGLFKSIQKIPFLQKKINLIPNAVDQSEINITTTIPSDIIQLKNDGCLIIGSIGRLIKGKGIDILIKALSVFNQQKWHLYIIGAGPEEENLKSLASFLGIQHRITFLGYRHDRLTFLKGFDIFALASLSEGTPRCVMEAMAANVPVVASDIEGCRNLITTEETGLLFPAGNSQALAACIKRLTEDRLLRENIVKSASSFVKKNFSATRMAKEYEDLFATLLFTD